MCVNRLVLFPPVNLSVAKFSGPTTESALVKGKCFPQQYKLRGGGAFCGWQHTPRCTLKTVVCFPKSAHVWDDLIASVRSKLPHDAIREIYQNHEILRLDRVVA